VLQQPRRNLTVAHRPCEPTNRRSLESLDLAGYQHLVVLADDRLDPDQADDRTLVTLLHLRDIETGYGDPYAIVTEVNDDANREIAQITRADDFIVSSKLISLLLTQLAENRHINPILAELFDPAGAEILLRRAMTWPRGAEPP
jgi:ion channel POLLUX/CASTOR